MGLPLKLYLLLILAYFLCLFIYSYVNKLLSNALTAMEQIPVFPFPLQGTVTL